MSSKQSSPVQSSAGTTAWADGQTSPVGSKQHSYDWRRQWYPVAIVRDLEAVDPRKPTRIELLGEAYAIWKDVDGEWVAFVDRCPHRAAPLSEGRVDQDSGRLMCIYHGWEFNGDGTCENVPQAEENLLSNVVSSKRACALQVPTTVAQGKLWAWPDGTPHGVEASRCKLPTTLPDMDDPEFNGNWYMRDIPYGWDTLVENLGDPAHIPFAHHGVIGRRSMGNPLDISMKEGEEGGGGKYTTEGFGYVPGTRDMTLGFRAEGLMVYYCSDYTHSAARLARLLPFPWGALAKVYMKLDRKMSMKAEDRGPCDRLKNYFVGYVTPTAPGKSRIFTRTARNFFFNKPIFPSFLRLQNPIVRAHLAQHLVLDGDTPALHFQERELYAKGETTVQGGNPDRSFYMPTVSDVPVRAFRRWLKDEAGGGPVWPMGKDAPLGPVLPREVMLDRLHSHTLQCSECSKAYHGAGKAKKGFGIGSFLCLAAAAAAPRGTWATGLVGGAIVNAAMALYMVRREQEFVFVDYVHASRDG
ncbi:unnamed protein product [Discosporangium mesarthrocarpum]